MSDERAGLKSPRGTTVEVRLTEETIEYLDERIAEAVRKGIVEAVNEETAQAFWSAGIKVLQSQATNHAGRFVIGGLWGIARRISTFMVLGGIVYAIGGWAGLAKLWHALFNGA